jgi:small subunit ribosomal protein S1
MTSMPDPQQTSIAPPTEAPSLEGRSEAPSREAPAEQASSGQQQPPPAPAPTIAQAPGAVLSPEAPAPERPAPPAPAAQRQPSAPQSTSRPQRERPEAPKAPGKAPELDAQTAAEIDAAMAELDAMGAMDAAGPGASAPAAGPRAPGRPGIRGPREVRAGREHRVGVVVTVGPTDIFVEFGPKELGIVPREQWKEGEELPAPGAEVELVVDRYEADESLYICSRPGAVQKAGWETLEPGQVIEARCTGVNKGGLDMEITGGHHAFMPASQVSLDHIPDLSVFVGEKMTCQVQRVDRRGKGNVILSRRDMLRKEREQRANELRETLKEGQTVEGVVRKIMPFGAFIDIGGIDGLVHLNDLTHERIGHGERAVSRYLQEGQQVRAQVLKIDWDAGRISLGIKQLEADPFQTATSDITEGAQVSGRVTRTTEFGAFVEIAPGVEGLVHISELAWRRVGKVEDVVKKDEVIQVQVLGIDPESRRIGLSVKATQPRPEPTGGGKRGRRDEGPSAEEILKETPALRRLREQAKQREREKAAQKGEKPKGRRKGEGGLGEAGGMGIGLGDLRL